MYMSLFRNAPSSLSSIPAYLGTVTKDKGFSLFTVVIKTIIGNHYVIFFLIIAVLQLVIIALVYRKYSEDYWFSIFVFIASTDYISWVHNGTRQFLAATIILAATPLILNKKNIWALILILLAATFHLSALLMIPIFIIVQGRAWNWKTWALLVAAIIVLFTVDRFTGLLDTLLSDTQYSAIVSDWTEWGDDGTNPIRVVVYAIPMILSIIGLRYIRNEGDQLINMCVGLSIASTAFYLVSVVTSGIFVGRIPIYMTLYSNGILLPWLINHMFTDRSIRVIKTIAVLLFSMFFYYQMHFTWHML